MVTLFDIANGTRQIDHTGRQHLEAHIIVVQRDPDLNQVVLALRSPRGFSGLLNGGQKQRHKNGDDGDHHQKFNQREATLTGTPPGGQRQWQDDRFHGVMVPVRVTL